MCSACEIMKTGYKHIEMTKKLKHQNQMQCDYNETHPYSNQPVTLGSYPYVHVLKKNEERLPDELKFTSRETAVHLEEKQPEVREPCC